ncbi:MAG: GNAT family N-acetyltransferase [Candidatus Zixiibacteriota bacterium]
MKQKSATADDAHIDSLLRDNATYLIAAIENDEPVGFLIAYLLPRLAENRPMMLFYEIEVRESHRRRGVARAMIDKLCEYCREQHVLKMWVLTEESNPAAMQLYEATGGVRADGGDTVMFEYREF